MSGAFVQCFCRAHAAPCMGTQGKGHVRMHAHLRWGLAGGQEEGTTRSPCALRACHKGHEINTDLCPGLCCRQELVRKHDCTPENQSVRFVGLAWTHAPGVKGI